MLSGLNNMFCEDRPRDFSRSIRIKRWLRWPECSRLASDAPIASIRRTNRRGAVCQMRSVGPVTNDASRWSNPKKGDLGLSGPPTAFINFFQNPSNVVVSCFCVVSSGWRSVESMRSSATVTKRVQYAALPYRLRGTSHTEVMLVTSRETRRWIIPKGWPQKGRPPHRSAAREAFEEAGVIGAVDRRPVGSFPYEKRLKNGGVIVCEVHVYPLKVLRQTKRWPERRQRKVKWLSANEAATAVRDPRLGTIIRRLVRTSNG